MRVSNNAGFRLVLTFATLSACGGPESRGVRGPTGPELMVVSRAGANLRGPGITVVIPPGALADATTIGIAENPTDAAPNQVIETRTSVFGLTPHGQTFDNAVTLRISLQQSEEGLGLYTAEPGGNWRPVAGARIVGGELVAEVQHFSFFAVGKLLVQPPQTQWTSTSILFVVDESNSMSGEQATLARALDQFITEITKRNAQRIAAGMDPVEFRAGVTSSSVFMNEVPNVNNRCTNVGGSNRCCANSVCTPCAVVGEPCSTLMEKYRFPPGCSAGHALNGAPYPAGALLAKAGNPKVIQLPPELYEPKHAPELELRKAMWRENLVVGSCGSGQEMHLEAGKLAVEKALAGTQPDIQKDEWLPANSKLVVVWIGDEDDCSAPAGAIPLMFAPGGSCAPGEYCDYCVAETFKPLAQQRFTPVAAYERFFLGLGRPFAAAFLVSTEDGTCSGDGESCKPGLCKCQDTSCGATACKDCGGVARPTRMAELATRFRAANRQVYVGGICDQSYAGAAARVATFAME